ncbi:MAG: RNA polymerase sigma factor [Solirubrobacteraceae bacterium]
MAAAHQLDPERLGDHLDRLYRAAVAMCGDRHEAEDLVQETYERVLRRPRLVRGSDDLGYLLRALRNTYASRVRTATRRPRTSPLPEPDSPAGELPDTRSPGPADSVVAREVYAHIAALPPDFRDAIVAVDVLGLSYAEAARALRAREATITTRLHRARLRVAAALEAGEGGAEDGSQ